MLFTYTFSLSHDNLSVSMLQRKNRRVRQGKIICLGCCGKKLSPRPASTLAIPPLEKGSQARKHWVISGVWRKLFMPDWWETTGSFPTPAGKWRLSTIAGKRLRFPPTSKTLSCKDTGLKVHPGTRCLSPDPATDSVPLGHQWMLLSLPSKI